MDVTFKFSIGQIVTVSIASKSLVGKVVSATNYGKHNRYDIVTIDGSSVEFLSFDEEVLEQFDA